MKKTFLTLLLCVAVSAAYAQKISVVSGNIKFLNDESRIGVVFTYDNMRVGKLTEEAYTTKKVEDYNKKEADAEMHGSWLGRTTARSVSSRDS